MISAGIKFILNWTESVRELNANFHGRANYKSTLGGLQTEEVKIQINLILEQILKVAEAKL